MRLLYLVCFCWCLSVATCSIEDRLHQIETQLDQLRETINLEKCDSKCEDSNEPKNANSQLINLSQMQHETILDQSTWIHLGFGYSRLTTLEFSRGTRTYYYVMVGNDQGVRIYDLDNKMLVQTFDKSYVYDMKRFGRDLFIQASNSTQIKIWNFQTGVLVNTLSGHADKTTCIALNKDQNLMLTGGDDRKVILWEIGNEFKQIRTHTGHTDWIRSVVFVEPKSQFLSASDDKTVRVWNINDGSLVRILTGHTDYVLTMLLDESTGLLYTGGRDSFIKEWNIDNGRCLRNLTGHTNSVFSLQMSPDGARILSGSSDSSINVWNKFSGRVITKLKYTSSISYLAISPSNNQLLSTSDDEKLIFWAVKA